MHDELCVLNSLAKLNFHTKSESGFARLGYELGCLSVPLYWIAATVQLSYWLTLPSRLQVPLGVGRLNSL